jgi:polysaccharide export outer membrane protein
VRLVFPAFLIASFFTVSTLFGCATGPDASSDLAMSTPYRVGPSDTLTVKVLPDPAIELTPVKVRPDGKVSIDLIGDVQAAGRTTDEIAAEITDKMAEFRQSPTVSVAVEAPTSTTISVIGEVKSPGSFALDRDIRVAEAIAMAGGATELSATGRVRVVRREGGTQTVLMISDLDETRAGDGSTDMVLQKGDLVVVPAAYPVVAGYELRKFLYPIESVFRVIGAGLFLLFR